MTAPPPDLLRRIADARRARTAALRAADLDLADAAERALNDALDEAAAADDEVDLNQLVRDARAASVGGSVPDATRRFAERFFGTTAPDPDDTPPAAA